MAVVECRGRERIVGASLFLKKKKKKKGVVSSLLEMS